MSDLDYITQFQAQCREPDAGADDAGTDFYLRAARSRRAGVLSAVFPRLLRALGTSRGVVVSRYRDVAATDPDWYRNASLALELVEALIAEGAIPNWAGDLARHEWTFFETGLREMDPPQRDERDLINPTLRAFEYAYDLPRWLVGQGRTPILRGELGPVHIGYYQHFETGRPTWLELTPNVLAALRLVQEGLSTSAVADALGVDEAVVLGAVDRVVMEGLVRRLD